MSQKLHLNFPAFINLFNGKEEVKYQNAVFSFTKNVPPGELHSFYGIGRNLNDNLDLYLRCFPSPATFPGGGRALLTQR